MLEDDSFNSENKYDKILIIADPHGLINELKEFIGNMQELYGNTIAYCIQLGDFWKGRNVVFGKKTFNFWKDLTAFYDLPFPIYCIKGNEDINIPDEWWKSGMISLLPNLQDFMLEDFRVIPIDYFEEDPKFYKKMGIKKFVRLSPPPKFMQDQYYPFYDFEPRDDVEPHPVLTSEEPIDFVLSHVPAYGLLDKTRDAKTHKEIRFTGNKFIRLVIDRRRPKIVFFGHNHFANYQIFGDMLVISCDKFVRKIPAWADESYLSKKSRKRRHFKKKLKDKSKKKDKDEKNLFSYCLIQKTEQGQILEMYRCDKLIFRYDINDKNILLSRV
ncbi:MAG: hypothetical protein GF364_11255 [Candidatus Lokiarchaeota archaeon]|nr:hypothetical protein [Candidatus Lokiarchaeota archaeon]